jgi:hypothetical protein
MGLLWSVTMQAASYEALDFYPYPAAAGQTNSSAMSLSDAAFTAWADGYTDVQYGSNVSESWQTPVNALGAATGGSSDIVCLGRGGQITLTFSGGIKNGDGADFAVFENGYSDSFLELAFVEVSSDGIHFVRFPNYSLNASAIGGFGAVDTTKVYGLAGKYRAGYGTPFDLDDLLLAYEAQLEGNTDFSETFAEQLTNGVPLLDLEHITCVRMVDIIGDGSQAYDCRGWSIYDPYPTTGSAGFDLDAVGVIHPADQTGTQQVITFAAIPHQKYSFESVTLEAAADSGLPVSFALQSGPAAVTNDVLYFTGTGTVEVAANQLGDSVYAPAAPVLRSFVVAEELQHIYFEQIPNQLAGGEDVQLYAESSQGLPVSVEVFEAPDDVVVDSNLVMQVGAESGSVVLRAFQAGNAFVAPAEAVYVSFSLVEAGASNAPVSLEQWLVSNSVPPLTVAATHDVYGRPAALLQYELDLQLDARCRLMQSGDLVSWSYTVPERMEQTAAGDALELSLQLLISASNRYYRLQFDSPE